MDSSAGKAGRLAWYARRLGSMTPGEVVWRGSRWVSERRPTPDFSSRSATKLLHPKYDLNAVAERFREHAGRPLLLDRRRAQAIAARRPDEVATLVAAAERVRAGTVKYFGYPEVRLANPVDWNHDLLRDFHWPLRESTKIDHRVAKADPKWIWELNRLQHLPWLAEAWLFTGDDGFAELALDHLDSWMDQNPVGYGIAWRGAFEAGVRAISVAVALQGLRDCPALTAQRFERSVRMLAASADLCWRNRSRFSSANNHLVGELAGLATVAMLFPELRSARRWERLALQGLTAEAPRQILADGAGAEQAVGYQIFTAELMLMVAALLQSRGDAPPAPLLAAIDRSAEYLASLVGDHDPEPRYGDDDEGFALRLGPESRRSVRDHLGIVSALSGNNRARQAGTVTLPALWVGATVEAADLEQVPTETTHPGSAFFKEGGLVVLRSGNRRLTMDVGPLGYLSIAAHGHADALGVTLSLEGQEVIGHPGAASYYGHPEWRQVHRGTRIQPTVTVDGQSQSVSGGPFLWTEQARVRVRGIEVERGVVDAQHDGYRRLPRPAIHRRWLIALPEEQETVLVVDELTGSDEHEMRVAWPLHPSLHVDRIAFGHQLTRNGVPIAQVLITATADLAIDEVRGDDATNLGWWSHRLEARVPSWLIGGVAKGQLPMVSATIVHHSRQAGVTLTEPAVSLVGDLITTSWYSQGLRCAAVIDRSRSAAVDIRLWPMS